MAATKFSITPGPIALLQADAAGVLVRARVTAAANRPTNIRLVKVTPNGITATDALLRVQVFKGSTGGTFTNTAQVPKKRSTNADAVQAVYAYPSSAAPTDGECICDEYVHPFGGKFVAGFGEDELQLAGGANLDIKVTPAATLTAGTSVLIEIQGEE